MKIVFMGTPEFAVPTLQRLCKGGLAPAVVYAQPPRRSGRGLKVSQPPVAIAACEPHLPLRQPRILQRRNELTFLEQLAPDLIVTAAYGKIFRRRLLELPRLGCINLHPSLLPRYRGLTPIPWAILRGETLTGVTVYRMDIGVDSGPILIQRALPILPEDTAGSLGKRLAGLGADAVVEAIRGLAAGKLRGRPQDEALASYAPRLDRDDGAIDWRLPASQIERQVRAFDPWPGTFSYRGAGRLKLLAVGVVDEIRRPDPPGTVLLADGKQPPVVAALPGAVSLLRVQPANGRPQDGAAFCRGQRLREGERLTARAAGGEGGR